MSDLGETIKVPAVRFERLLPGPLDRVWEHISTPDKLTGWFGEESATNKSPANTAAAPAETAKNGCHPAISCGSASTLFCIRRVRFVASPLPRLVS